MSLFCNFCFFYKRKLSGFVVSLYKAVVGFLRVSNCETLILFKSLSLLKVALSLEHNHIKEQDWFQCALFLQIFENLG